MESIDHDLYSEFPQDIDNIHRCIWTLQNSSYLFSNNEIRGVLNFIGQTPVLTTHSSWCLTGAWLYTIRQSWSPSCYHRHNADSSNKLAYRRSPFYIVCLLRICFLEIVRWGLTIRFLKILLECYRSFEVNGDVQVHNVQSN